jgi:hypothetical protein
MRKKELNKDIGFLDNLPSIEVVGKNKRFDGWSNALSGMGYSKDKRKYTKFSATSGTSAFIDKNSLVEMYAYDGLISRLVDVYPDDMTREWISIPSDEDETIINELERLGAENIINTASKWSRLLGGSLIFIGAMDGQGTENPLDLKKIKNIEYLKVYDLGDIKTEQSIFITDPNNPNFGEIELYAVNVRIGNSWQLIYLHRNRCIPIYGVKIPTSLKLGSILDLRYWGNSIIPPVYTYIQDYLGAMGSVSNVLYELIIGKYKFSDLDEMLVQGNESRLRNRMEAIDATKSVLHSIFLGSDEEYTRDVANLSGVSDVLDRFMMHVSLVTGIPVTKLFGRSPAGLNATGENDIKSYYDSVRSKQKNELTKPIQTLIDIISVWKGKQTGIKFIFNPLNQTSDKEESDIRRVDAETYRTQADADQRYIDTGVLMPDTVYNMRFKDTLGEQDFTETPEEPDGPDLPEDDKNKIKK